ncbi:chromate efflux transporter [Geomicrobium sediminis]|uniref:Chromate transporter n=1 Tax=Geomicrobium sediminis TaxID=1347788 RepID=A0ABS2PH57_9BACL|nr:chromate transporter [Geomicrobium sediminis]
MNPLNQLKNLLQIFLISTRLGLTSFGGPIAHLGYFHEEYVKRKKWLDEKSYADLVALCQFLPGPASSQVGIGIGVIKGGVIGGFLSFLGFTMPSVLLLILFAQFASTFGLTDAGFIDGLKLVAVAVVAHAILGMAKNLTPDLSRQTIALVALMITVLIPHALAQVVVIALAAIVGFVMFRDPAEQTKTTSFPLSKRFGVACLTLFAVLLVSLPLLAQASSSMWLDLFDRFYRAGALVFGGGHVVLPLLEREFVPTGLISADEFLAGYGAAQAVPGPLFTFAAYIGTVIAGSLGGLFATVAIFLPAFLLIFGVLPFWQSVRHHEKLRGAFLGVNAAVVGILISAFFHPIWVTSVQNGFDFAIAALLFFMLMYWKRPPWVIVLTGIVLGTLFYS